MASLVAPRGVTRSSPELGAGVPEKPSLLSRIEPPKLRPRPGLILGLPEPEVPALPPPAHLPSAPVAPTPPAAMGRYIAPVPSTDWRERRLPWPSAQAVPAETRAAWFERPEYQKQLDLLTNKQE